MKKVTPEQLKEEINKDIAAFRNSVANELQEQIIENAPAVEGTLRGNIKAFVNTQNEQYDENNKDANGQATKTENTGRILQSRNSADTIKVVSQAPYSQRIEFEGHSGLAPSGFVRIALESLQSLIQRAKENIQRFR